MLKYYLACPECGCEYAFNDEELLVERTYFIKCYILLNKQFSVDITLKELSKQTHLSVDRLKRCFAYFNSRGIALGIHSRKCYSLNEHLLDDVINAVRADVNIKEIGKWNVWDDYNHFLYYRYHKDVLKLLIEKDGSKPYIHKDNSFEKLEHIKQILNEMAYDEASVTIESVCKKLRICPETLRNWGGNSLVSEVKSKQNEYRTKRRTEILLEMVENYIERNRLEFISTKELYKYLGVSRNVLWRNAPEVTALIHKTVKEHNGTLLITK